MHINLVPPFQVELLSNTVKTRCYDAFLNLNAEYCKTLLKDIKSRGLVIAIAYFIQIDNDIGEQLIQALSFNDRLQDEEKLALTDLIQKALYVCNEEINTRLLQNLYTIHKNGFEQIQQIIYGHLRRSKCVKILAEIFIKQRMELVENNDYVYDEDIISVQEDITYFIDNKIEVQHPYFELLKLSINTKAKRNIYQVNLQDVLKYMPKFKRLFNQIQDKNTYKLEIIQRDTSLACNLFANFTEEETLYLVENFKQQIKDQLSENDIKFLVKFINFFDEQYIKCQILKNSSILLELNEQDQKNYINLVPEIYENLQQHEQQILQVKIAQLNLFDLLQKITQVYKPLYDPNDLKLDTTNINQNIKVLQLQSQLFKQISNQDVLQLNYEYFLIQSVNNNLEDIQKIRNLLQTLVDLSKGDSKFIIQYPYYLELLIVLLFETKLDNNLKANYLQVIEYFVQQRENVILIRRSQLILKLIFYLRFESDLQQNIIKIVQNCMVIKFSPSYLNSISIFMSPYPASLIDPYFKNEQIKNVYNTIKKHLEISSKTIKSLDQNQYDLFLERFNDKKLFDNNLSLLLDCVKNVIKEQNQQETYYFFLGRDSMIRVQGKIFLDNGDFCIIFHLKYFSQGTLFQFQFQDFFLTFLIENNNLIIRYEYPDFMRQAKFLIYNDSMITINFKQTFKVFINGQSINPISHELFENILFSSLNSVIFGASLSKDGFGYTNCITCEMRFFYLFDISKDPETIYQLYDQKAQKNSSVFTQMFKMQQKEKPLLQLNSQYSQKQTPKSIFLFQSLETDLRPMFCKSDSMVIARNPKKKEPQVASKSLGGYLKKITKQSMLGQSNMPVIDNEVTLETKNVLFQESTTLLDIIKNVGDVDILFFPLHLFENSPINVQKLLEIIKLIIDKYGDDNQIQTYLRSDGKSSGLQILQYLITQYIQKYGCNLELANSILDLFVSLIRPKQQIIQTLKHDSMCIFYSFEIWQHCDYAILQLVFGRLLELLDKDEQVYNYFKEKKIIDDLFYINSIQLKDYNPNFGDLRIYQNVKSFILKSVIYIMYNPFAIIQQGTLLPELLELRPKQPVEKHNSLKSELNSLFYHAIITYNYEYLKIINFALKKGQQTIILELMYEDRKRPNTSPNKIMETLGSQFGIAFKDGQDDQNVTGTSQMMNKFYVLIYGMITDLIIKKRDKKFNLTITDVEDPFDAYISILNEILIKLQVLYIALEQSTTDQQNTKQAQQIMKEKESKIIRQLLQYIKNILDKRIQYGVKTYQTLLNLFHTLFKKNLSMEQEILDILIPRFSNMNSKSQEMVIEFILQYQNKTHYKFVSDLCFHADILEFVRMLIMCQYKDKGLMVTNYIIHHHIENIRHAARKIIRFFHYANYFSKCNQLLLLVLQTILSLQNGQNKQSVALIEFFLIFPTLLKVYPDMILQDPSLFIRVFQEYIVYLERMDVMVFHPDTEFIAFYEYEINFSQKLFQEIETQSMIQNGGILSTVLFILFYALELLINTPEAKQLILIWKKLVSTKYTSDLKVREDQQVMIDDQQIPNLQTKIKKIRIESQKPKAFQIIQSFFTKKGVQNQYEKYFYDIHIFYLLKLQLMSLHSHVNELYEVFQTIQQKQNFQYFNEFSFLYIHLPKFNDQFFRFQLQKDISLKDIEQITDIMISKFNSLNQIVKEAKQSADKPPPELEKFKSQIKDAKNHLKYLELFKDSDLIRRVIIYMSLYSYRQIQFAQDLAIVINLYHLQMKVQDLVQMHQDIEQSSGSFKIYDSLPEFAINAFIVYNTWKQETQIIQVEKKKNIDALILVQRVKSHFKNNTHKRSIWYFMNESDRHLYNKLKSIDINRDSENLISQLQSERYQINNFEDKLRRRMFLKVYAKLKRQYPVLELKLQFNQYFNDIVEVCTKSIQSIKIQTGRYSEQKKRFSESMHEYEKIDIQAEMVTQRGYYSGSIKIVGEYLIFDNYNDQSQPRYKFQKDSLIKNKKIKVIKLNEIVEVHPRHYLLQPTAIEIFTINNKSYFFNVFEEQQVILKTLVTQDYHKLVSDNLKNLIDKWKKSEITNFQYLIEINKAAGRTYNDINQYPVFPWVQWNFEEFDISKPENYRNLELPIGAQNKKRLEQFVERFKQCDPEDMNTYFIYGTHYSHSAIVLSFLTRLEPFATLHQEMQSGRFDKPDRLFHSIQSQWQSVCNSSSDVKEMIPEFYYFPDFLKNKNQFDFGQLQSGTVVSDVTLPNYVTTQTSEQLIYMNMLMLESEYVNQNLNKWIDLIFGYKSGFNQVAIDNYNLFHRLTYSSQLKEVLSTAEDEFVKEQLITQVYYYGQTPQQLFKKEHFQRQKQSKETEQNKLQLTSVNPIVNCFDQSICKIIQTEKYYIIITENFTVFSFPNELKLNNYKLQKEFLNKDKFKELQLNIQDNIKEKIIDFEDCLAIAGHQDNCIKIYTQSDLKLIFQLAFHRKLVTCLAKSHEKSFLAFGGQDTTISLWQYDKRELKIKQILYGHRAQIQQIVISETLMTLTSVDVLGDILIHSFHGDLLSSIELNQNIDMIQIHQMGYILAVRNNEITILTLNGDLYTKREFKQYEQITAIEVISHYHPEFVKFQFYIKILQKLISTKGGDLFITSIFQIKLNEDSTKCIKRQFILDEMEYKLENNQTKKVKELKQLDLQQQIQFLQYYKQQVLLGYQNGNILVLYEF